MRVLAAIVLTLWFAIVLQAFSSKERQSGGYHVAAAILSTAALASWVLFGG